MKEEEIRRIIEEVKKWKEEVLEYTKKEYREIYPLIDFAFKILEDNSSHPHEKLRAAYDIWLIHQKAQENKKTKMEK
jgi:hypothetical protein